MANLRSAACSDVRTDAMALYLAECIQVPAKEVKTIQFDAGKWARSHCPPGWPPAAPGLCSPHGR
jgi:hypothetical protein